MDKTVKIAISIPAVDFYKIEKIRKKLKYKRSAIIDNAVRFWLNYWERKDLIKRYETGYREKPESLKEITAMEKSAAQAFREEEL